MIFQLSKPKNLDAVRPVESETLQRWRELSKNEEKAEEALSEAAASGAPELKAEPTWSEQFNISAPEPQVPAWSLEASLESWRKSAQGATAPAAQASVVHKQAIPASPASPVNPSPVNDQDVRSALGPGTVIEGKLRFDAPVRIDGNLIGEVTSSSMLVVGEQALVKAIVNVGTLVVRGQVTGQVEASEKIEVKEGGILEANIKTKQLIIDEGGFFRGGCNT